MKNIITFLVIAALIFGVVWYLRKQKNNSKENREDEAADSSSSGGGGSAGAGLKNENVSPEEAVRAVTNTSGTLNPTPRVRPTGKVVETKVPMGRGFAPNHRTTNNSQRRQIQS